LSFVDLLHQVGNRLRRLDDRPALRTARLAAREWTLTRLTLRRVPALQPGTVSLEDAEHVLLRCGSSWNFSPETYSQESAFAAELACRGRDFAVTDQPELLVGKSVVWFPPHDFLEPRLWDYSRQIREFAAGLESQGNRMLCSAAEIAFWENKVHMHERLAEIGAPTPLTRILNAENWEGADFDIEPVLIKEEHSAGSAGIHHFPTAQAARAFIAGYDFRPEESLIMQEIVEGATRDLRVTMVGDQVIRPATYWRAKSSTALKSSTWTTTATSNDSIVEHDGVPDAAARFAGDFLAKLGVRTAGVDLMWRGDDLSGDPLILEFSPYYQPNPPKPARYDAMSYKDFKSNWSLDEGYFPAQHRVFREISGAILDQGLF
jgi:hypothetical protein